MAILAAIAAQNGGEIRDCYAIWDKKYKGNKTLVSSNQGKLSTSALIVKRTCKEIYDSRERLNTDYPIQKTSDIKNLGFDTKTYWEYAGTDTLIGFQGNNWHVKGFGKAVNTIHIGTVDDYRLFADRVNNGDKRFIEANVYLDTDLDFKGKNIPIIGKTRETAFAGTFDGRDHLVWNGTIRDEDALYLGMFGYLKGKVINVTFDGRVQSDKNLAGICGLNMGTISCSGSVVRLKPKEERYNAAGIVAINEGIIDRCYAVLDKQIIIPPFVYILIIALIAILLGLLAYFAIISALASQQDYAKIETDPGQKKEPNDNMGPSQDNSLSFTLYETVEVSRSARICYLTFVNPSNDPNKVVVELQVEDGSGQRVTVGSSKAVMPGYSISSLPITNASALAGTDTKGYIVLVPYDVTTENKAFVKTELPVSIHYMD